MVTMDMPRLDEVSDIGEARPTVQVKYVDTNDGGVWVTWRWEHALDKPRIWGIQPAQLAGAMAAFAPAIPTPQQGESADDALRRAWLVWGDLEREKQLSWALSGSLIPGMLGVELNHFLEAGMWPHVRIQPSRALGAVPWQALRVDEGERMVHNGDVSALLPASVRNSRRRAASPDRPNGSVVAAVNPVVPGRIPGLGSVLREHEPIVEESLATLGDRLRGSVRPHLSRAQLRDALGEAGRLLYVGHVTGGGYGLDTRLHLTDGPEGAGRAEVIAGQHRPLTAADIAFDDGWIVPARVALIACGSGRDATFADPTGLVSAVAMRGARWVTSARWSLPTDVGLEWLQASGLSASATESSAPFSTFASMVAAVNDAQEQADPVAALGAWQRGQADLWERTGDAAYSPLIWGALTTTVS
ncbi:CHAT domain-containing protein [Microbacterium gubbeenense]|uniref:CHAT domain-containing protein n=1 Tax=Microbacterium gubbeenense TaxID=159896 RepID=UPI003F95A451